MTTEQQFTMKMNDVFEFAGRTVFVGEITGDPHYVHRGLVEIWVDNEKKSAPIRIEGELLSEGPPSDSERGGLGSISTVETRCLDHEAVSRGRWELRSSTPFSGAEGQTQRSISMYRHLLGLESPPSDYVPDPMTQGPVLPEGWDGDAWVSLQPDGYFLRAWNPEKSLVAYGRGKTYKSARESLMEEVRGSAAS